MTLDVFRSVSSARAAIFRFRQDDGPGPFRPLIMFINVVDINERPINNPGYSRPFSGAFAALTMSLRRFVLRRWGGEHDQAAAIFHLRVSEFAVRPNHARSLAEAKSHREPVQRAPPVFIRNHWDYTLNLFRHSVSFNKLYIRKFCVALRLTGFGAVALEPYPGDFLQPLGSPVREALFLSIIRFSQFFNSLRNHRAEADLKHLSLFPVHPDVSERGAAHFYIRVG